MPKLKPYSKDDKIRIESLSRLVKTFLHDPSRFSAEAMSEFLLALSEIPTKTLEAVVSTAIREHEFFPKPAELLKIYRRDHAPDPQAVQTQSQISAEQRRYLQDKRLADQTWADIQALPEPYRNQLRNDAVSTFNVEKAREFFGPRTLNDCIRACMISLYRERTK